MSQIMSMQDKTERISTSLLATDKQLLITSAWLMVEQGKWENLLSFVTAGKVYHSLICSHGFGDSLDSKLYW